LKCVCVYPLILSDKESGKALSEENLSESTKEGVMFTKTSSEGNNFHEYLKI